MVFKQALLVSLEHEPFDALTGQEEEPPVRVLDELGTGGLVLLQIEQDIGERRHGDVRRCDSLMDSPLKYPEVTEGREEPLGDPAGRLLTPPGSSLALLDPATYCLPDIIDADLAQPAGIQRDEDLGHDIVQKPIGSDGMEVKDAIESGSGEPLLDQCDQSMSNRELAEIALPEDRHDVFDPRSRCFTEDVLLSNALEIGLNGLGQVPM
jgi:hypothetical protein